MANELTINMNASFTKNGATFSRFPSSFNVTCAGDYVQSGVMLVGTAAEALPLGDVATPGYLLIHNLDATNFIEVGYDDTGFKNVVKVSAGKWGLCEMAQAAPQVKADTGACKAEYYLFPA